MDLPRYHTCASPPTCRIYVHPFRNSFGLIDLCRLSQDTRLTSDSCSSGWCFAIGFLHRGRFLPRLAELLVLPLFGRTADFHRIDTRALLGAQKKSRLEKSRRDRMVVRDRNRISLCERRPQVTTEKYPHRYPYRENDGGKNDAFGQPHHAPITPRHKRGFESWSASTTDTIDQPTP